MCHVPKCAQTLYKRHIWPALVTIALSNIHSQLLSQNRDTAGVNKASGCSSSHMSSTLETMCARHSKGKQVFCANSYLPDALAPSKSCAHKAARVCKQKKPPFIPPHVSTIHLIADYSIKPWFSHITNAQRPCLAVDMQGGSTHTESAPRHSHAVCASQHCSRIQSRTGHPWHATCEEARPHHQRWYQTEPGWC